MSEAVKVSVILPVHNGAEFISSAMDSILAQDYPHLELIVVDDASSDGTVGVIRSYRDQRLHLVRLARNMGPAHARNVGLRRSRGSWVGFIDADDVWHRSRLSKLMSLSQEYHNVCVASDVLACLSGRQGQLIPLRSVSRARGRRESVFGYGSMAEFAALGFDLKPICPRSAIVQHRIFFRAEDHGTEWREFLLRLLYFGLSFVVLNEPLYRYRVVPNSLSSAYGTLRGEIAVIDRLMALPWIDAGTRKALHRDRKEILPRLVTTALRQGKWPEAWRHGFSSPANLSYLVRRLPAYFLERMKAQIGQ